MSRHARHMQRCLANGEEMPNANPLSDGSAVQSAPHRDERGVKHGTPEERSSVRVQMAAGKEATPDEVKPKRAAKKAAPQGLTEPKQTGKKG